jgi:hypothetical protein
VALEDFKAPALPVPPPQYEQGHFNRLYQMLRVYFNQLDSDAAHRAYSYRGDYFIGGLHSGEGRGLILPHISASDGTDQYATADNTPTLVLWDSLESQYGFTLDPSGYAAPAYSGVYKIDYSIQLVNTDNAAHDVFLWLVVNGGTTVPNSSSRFTVPARKSVGDNGYLIAYSSITFEAQAGDAIRLYWATDKAYNPTGPVDGVFMEHLAEQTTPYARPANPSAVGSIVFVSALA